MTNATIKTFINSINDDVFTYGVSAYDILANLRDLGLSFLVESGDFDGSLKGQTLAMITKIEERCIDDGDDAYDDYYFVDCREAPVTLNGYFDGESEISRWDAGLGDSPNDGVVCMLKDIINAESWFENEWAEDYEPGVELVDAAEDSDVVFECGCSYNNVSACITKDDEYFYLVVRTHGNNGSVGALALDECSAKELMSVAGEYEYSDVRRVSTLIERYDIANIRS